MPSSRTSCATWLSLLSAGMVAIAWPGCGRTELDIAEPCDPIADTTRACVGFCGGGTQSCIEGTWHACVVPVVTRVCANDCGAGTESCFDKQWHSCEVAAVTRTCTSPCGEGHESCASGRWGAARRPPAQATHVAGHRARFPRAQSP